jgi:hypothetical protein
MGSESTPIWLNVLLVHIEFWWSMNAAFLNPYTLRNPWNNLQVSGNPCIKIIIKVCSGFNVNKGCKLILISAIYDMQIYW